MPAPQSRAAVSGTLGVESGRLRSIFDLVATLKPVDGLSFAINYDWGHEGDGAGMPTANWHALSLTGRYDFNRYVGLSARGEVFADQQGTRTGNAQTLSEFTGTLHVTPLPWMRLRAEFRHDSSSAAPFLSGTQHVGDQNTLALGAGVFF